ncbi:hypothetical protein ElyMa_005852600 [Elysia marginata]|uniref:Uncharacterized protein n=1 Tax=Elysia marginata TaxID=1093978 RepID=A0AAV4FYZ0_9GAST|nr:hypothetical protein ElyMa_005852600 [Elysia marginata]
MRALIDGKNRWRWRHSLHKPLGLIILPPLVAPPSLASPGEVLRQVHVYPTTSGLLRQISQTSRSSYKSARGLDVPALQDGEIQRPWKRRD